MSAIFSISPGAIGLLVWVLWALIGAVAALLTSRFTGGRHSVWFDIIIAAVAAVLGGFLSVQFLGDTPMQLFLISILGAVFASAVAMWIVCSLYSHFSRKEP